MTRMCYSCEEERIAARKAMNAALRAGTLVRPGTCANCGINPSPRVVQGHHAKGYAPEHWLDITWLCTRCHHLAHAAPDAIKAPCTVRPLLEEEEISALFGTGYYERRYSRTGGASHLARKNLFTGERDVSVCGRWVPLGTGSQDEYERAEDLPLCQHCLSGGAVRKRVAA